jgi:tetratricopeptide (TPR) repeat protein
METTDPGPADKLRWERLVMRHPGLALRRLQALMPSREGAVARAALLAAFFVLERWGRAAELQDELQAALREAQQERALPEAAELSEAQGRLHYQRGDYAQACNAWSQTLDWAADDSRSACLARIGLAHLCFALGDWARGGRVLDQAELHYPQLHRDPYLRAKIALNRAVSLRTTQGPQAALPALQEALAMARAAGHRDYQAEAIWHRARGARDSGDAALALQLAQEALALAQRCGYRWLQAQAALLLSDLQSADAALGWAGQALALAEALQSARCRPPPTAAWPS